MSVIIPPLTKFCKGECKLEKSFNDDFGSNLSNTDGKDTYCKICRKKQLDESRARGNCKNKVIPGKRNQYFKERTQRLYGDRIPITIEEIEQLCIWLKHPEAWEGISKARTFNIKCTLRKQFEQIKYHSQWFPNK